jgi:DNA-binding NarL/FixJ family response regulator
MSDTEIARSFHTDEHPFTTTNLRALNTVAKNAAKQADIAMAQRLKAKGLSNIAIGKKMDINESSVRSLLAPSAAQKADVLHTVSQLLKENVDKKGIIDIGVGVENHLGISKDKLAVAVSMLKEEGYTVHRFKVPQVATGHETEYKVLAGPGLTQKQVWLRRNEVQQIMDRSDDGGRTFSKILPPISVSSKRLAIRYAEDGGKKLDGVVYVRPGVKDLSLGANRYAQVRIAIDGTHYIKGMAIYKNDLPKGVDLEFNTNKSSTGNKLDALKKLDTEDPENPFTSQIRDQIKERDPKTGVERVTSAMNIVNAEGSWDEWSKSISTQVLSKQSPKLAKGQLEMTFENKKNELDEIMSLTNPVVRRKLLESFASDADASSVHMKAAHLPRQRTQVILPISGMKDTDVYAPNFRNGERVVLIRYPHGGTFEIPELTVNNRHPEAKRLLGDSEDAVGINAKVAERLSGADFDGDTVLVIPQTHGREIKTSPALSALQGFDPISEFPAYEGMPKMTPRMKGTQMGLVSNLITDMTIQKASTADLAHAVKHSMVVIDAEKHNLNWKLSAEVNGIPALMKKYQGRSQGGASTLISRAGSQKFVPERIPRPMSKGGPVDKVTGEKVFVETGRVFTTPSGKIIPRQTESTKLAEVSDAHALVSKDGGTVIEKIYADHSNRLRALANTARKAAISTQNTPYSPSAKLHYKAEVDRLTAALHLAVSNKPLERQAQLLANMKIAAKKSANPGMDDDDLKKVKFKALAEARHQTGADKQQIVISDGEWAAIQAGAITTHRLSEILNNSNLDQVKKLATPKVNTVMTTAKQRRADAMLASGYTVTEVADALGVAVSTLKSSVSRKEG